MWPALIYHDPCQLPTHVDLLSIDVEALYMNVLTTLPWNELTIDVIMVEVKDGAYVSVGVYV